MYSFFADSRIKGLSQICDSPLALYLYELRSSLRHELARTPERIIR